MYRDYMKTVKEVFIQTLTAMDKWYLKVDVDSLSINVTNYVFKLMETIKSYGLTEDDLLTSIWCGLSVCFNSPKIDTIQFINGFVYRCVQNKILDYCRSASSKKNIPLNEGINNLANWSAMSFDSNEDSFDSITREFIKNKYEEKELIDIAKFCLHEELKCTKDHRWQKVIVSWFKGFSRGDISNEVGLSTRQVARIIEKYLNATKKRIDSISNYEDNICINV